MFQGVKSKLDLYIDTAAQVGTQVINNPKFGPAAGAISLSVWYAEISGALGVVAGALGAIGAAIAIYVKIASWGYDKRIKSQKLKQTKLEIKSLEQAMKKRGGN